jgi:chromosome partitioning protein
MIHAASSQSGSSRVIVVGNEKGGSGKSTLAIHIAVALLKAGEAVGTIDLDSRQKSFTRYIENRRSWAELVGRDIGIPTHICLDGNLDSADADERGARSKALTEAVEGLAQTCNTIVIDTPGQDNFLVRLVHAMADTLVTPLNDSFVDFDVLGNVDPTSFAVTGTSHYARLVEEARAQRQLIDRATTDWIVLRNRLSTFGSSRNKRLVGEGLRELATAEFPLRRRPRRARHLPRVLSARVDRGRRSRRDHARHTADHVARHGAARDGKPDRRDLARRARANQRRRTRRGLNCRAAARLTCVAPSPRKWRSPSPEMARCSPRSEWRPVPWWN